MIDTYSGTKYEETTKHSNIKLVSAESQILRDFKIGGISLYYLVIPPGSAILKNDVRVT
jgi:hypothetical protein